MGDRGRVEAVKDYIRIETQGGARHTVAVISDGHFILNLGDLSVRRVVGAPSSRPLPGSSFTTDLVISSWNGVIGALGVTVCYDPDILHLTAFSPSSDSPFYPDCFAEQSSSSGGMRIVCFQTKDWEAWETPLSLGTLTWEVMDSPISETQVKIQVTAIVDVTWQPVEVMTYGRRIVIATETLFLPLILREWER